MLDFTVVMKWKRLINFYFCESLKIFTLKISNVLVATTLPGIYRISCENLVIHGISSEDVVLLFHAPRNGRCSIRLWRVSSWTLIILSFNILSSFIEFLGLSKSARCNLKTSTILQFCLRELHNWRWCITFVILLVKTWASNLFRKLWIRLEYKAMQNKVRKSFIFFRNVNYSAFNL